MCARDARMIWSFVNVGLEFCQWQTQLWGTPAKVDEIDIICSLIIVD